MKIICTEHQKDVVLSALAHYFDCPFRPADWCAPDLDCVSCLNEHIEWEVTPDA